MRLLFIVFLLLLSVITDVFSQYGSYGMTDARSIGMGNTANATATDVYAIGINPALIAFPDSSESRLKIMIPGISGQILSNQMTFNDVNYYFGGTQARVLDSAEKQSLYGHFSNDGRYYFFATATPLAICYKPSSKIGTFGFAISEFISGNATVPKSLADLAFNGNQVGKEFNFDNLKFETWWIRSYSLSYSRNILKSETGFFKNLFAGLSLKYISGFAMTNLDYMSSSILTKEKNAIEGQINMRAYTAFSRGLGVKYSFDTTEQESGMGYFSKPAGTGFGLDLGISAELDTGFVVSIAVTDIGSINWTSNVAENYIQNSIYIDDLFNQNQVDSLSHFTEMQSKPLSNYSTKLPIALRFGLSFDMNRTFGHFVPGKMLLGFDYNQGLNMAPGNSTVPRFSLGFFWGPATYLPYISTGFSNDYIGKFRWSAGLGYSNSLIDISISTFDIITLFSPNSYSPHASFGFNLAWKILGE